MTRDIKTISLALTLTALIGTPACSAKEQMVRSNTDSTPAAVAQQDLEYAPSFKPVNEIAQPDFMELRVAQVSPANEFNQNLKKPREINPPPTEDGYHDPADEAVKKLQPPKKAFADLPPSDFGNHVDWVKAIDEKKIEPRWERDNPDAQPFVMDLDIVRPVKASVPDVVFPHRQHTEWLFCSNCHPAIFVPQRLGNTINMSLIISGEKCGVCHGKVSFPIETITCKKCHSKPKPPDWQPPLSKATLAQPWK
jgi:c(7)-type cytochrome triheme protein